MADRYNRIDNTSPLQSKVENDKLNIPRSVFDLSHIHSGQALIGALTPVLCRETIPNQEFDINLNALIELRNPTTRKLLNGCRVFFHAYFNRCSDLWEGFNNYIDLGRSGNMHLEKPHLKYKDFVISTSEGKIDVNACTPLSLMNYMGIPAEAIQYEDGYKGAPLWYFRPAVGVTDSLGKELAIKKIAESPDFIDALPFMAYQRNWRDFYSNKNLLQNNKFWFPDNEDHFILSYSADDCVAICYENEGLNKATPTGYDETFDNILGFKIGTEFPILQDKTFEPNNPSTVTTQFSHYPNLAGLKFRQFRGDRFTTALPFPDLIRGDVPSMGSGDPSTVYLENLSTGEVIPIDGSSDDDNINWTLQREDGRSGVSIVINSISADQKYALKVSSASQITQNDLRALEVFTVFKERMARTSGDYNDMIEAQFGYNPHVHSREGTYIGGCYQDLVFSSISQTSASTDESPLGTKAGQGVSSSSGRIGRFTAPDYGWIQIYMSIVPDVYYTQGIPKQFSRRVQEDNYFPIFNNLAPQAILNKELFVSGDSETDNDVYAFEDRYAEMKSIPNRVSGLSALGHEQEEYDSASVMSRRFTSTPALNSQFVTMVPENVDMDVFSFNDEPPFDFSIGFNITSVAPMPYTSVPGKMDLHA